jgi:hypothetical protein
MKTKIGILVALLFLAIFSIYAQQESSKALGTWKLFSFKYGDREEQTASDSFQRVKLITKTHFAWVKYSTNERIVTDSAGGRCEIDGENYIENIDFAGADMTDYLGKKQTFKLKFAGNKMYLSGNLSDNLKIDEVWIKLELNSFINDVPHDQK